MRLTLKNTFLSFEINPEANSEAYAESRCGTPKVTPRYDISGSPTSAHSSPMRRSRSAECLTGHSEDRSEEDHSMDRLNSMFGSPLRPAHAIEKQADAYGLLANLYEENKYSEKGIKPTGSCPFQDLGTGPSFDTVVLKSCDSVSTMASCTMQKEYCHKNVPRNVNLEEEYRKTASLGQYPTTLMIRNIPNRYTQSELVAELEDAGLGGSFDFLYLPLDRSSRASVGYAFVNFISYSWAELCRETLSGHVFSLHGKGKVAVISTAHLQGLEANLAHYKKTAVTKAKQPDHRPMIIAGTHEVLPPPR